MSCEDIKNQIKKHTKYILDDVIKIRRWIHKHPELSFQEKKTSEYICKVLKRYNISFKKNIGGYGVVALIKSPKTNNLVIGLRSDMDALPIFEKNIIDYKSINEGVMHACGHDVHTAIMLGTAIVLNKMKNELRGTVKFIFQPAEEKLPGGASIMINEGVLDNPKVDKMIALHVYPEFEVGNVGFRSGQYMAACDELYVTIKGKGGHAALPEKVINPITIAANMIVAINQKVMSLKDKEKYVLQFGDFHANGASNVIPEQAFLKGTLRTLNSDFRIRVHKVLLKISKEIEKKYLAVCDFEIRKGYPALYNDPELTDYCKVLSRDFLGSEYVQDLDIRMASEDFSYFSQSCPSCFFRLGVGNTQKGISHLVHTPYFNIDEDSLEIGVGLMSYLAFVNLLSQKKL